MRYDRTLLQPSWIEATLGAALAIAALIFTLSGGAPESEFDRRVAAVNTQLQSLGHLRRELRRHGADPARLEPARHRWEESRRRFGDLIAEARAAARTDAERRRVEQLALLATQ